MRSSDREICNSYRVSLPLPNTKEDKISVVNHLAVKNIAHAENPRYLTAQSPGKQMKWRTGGSHSPEAGRTGRKGDKPHALWTTPLGPH